MPLKFGDFFIIIPALGAVIVSFFFAYSGTAGLPSVFLKGESGEWVFPLDAVETILVSGPLGVTEVEISGGTARITASPCANRICIIAGAIRSAGQWTACLPNRVVLFIGEGGTEDDVDATAW